MHRSLVTWIAVSALTLAASAQQPAQPTPGPGTPILIDLSLPKNSSVSDLAKMLAEKYPQITCVLGPGVAKVPIGEIRLSRVNPELLPISIAVASGNQVRGQVVGSLLTLSLQDTPEQIREKNDHQIFALAIPFRGRLPEGADFKKEATAFFQAIRDTVTDLDKLNGRECFTITCRLVEENQLLIVMGNSDAMQVARDLEATLSPRPPALQSDPTPQPNTTPQADISPQANPTPQPLPPRRERRRIVPIPPQSPE